jgi:lysophospholipid acyltransferase (LPLAT)-like uncharacterized protein
MAKLNKKIKKVKRLPVWMNYLAALFIKCLIRCFYRVKIVDPNGSIYTKENFVVVIWHNRLIFMPAVFPAAARKRTKAVISASRDGQYLSDLVHQFGLGTVRGSSSRKAASVQLNAIKAINENWHVCFTPDGPRGPKYKMHRGPVHLASLTGRRVLPVMINASRYWQLKSWDNFQIPKPFSKLEVILSDPIAIPANLEDKKDLEAWREKVENKLMEITKD